MKKQKEENKLKESKTEETTTTKLTIVKDGVEEEREMKKPSPEEITQFKEDFEKSLEEFKLKKWEISEKGQFGANDVLIFLLNYLDKFVFWTKTGWMGVLKFREELEKAKVLSDDNTGLALDYQSLEFCAYMLTNPGGTGYNLALEFEKIADKYSKISMVVAQKVEDARNELKGIQYKQEKWGASEQGFYLADLEPEIKEATGEQLVTEQPNI